MKKGRFWGGLKKNFSCAALVHTAFQRFVHKSARKIFGEADSHIIFATRFEKKAMFFAGTMNVMAGKNSGFSFRKIWWLTEQSYLRRPLE